MQKRPRRPLIFGIVLLIIGSSIFSLELSTAFLNIWLPYVGGALFVLDGAVNVILFFALTNKFYTYILSVISLVLSVACTMFAMLWILAFQVVIATRESKYGSAIENNKTSILIPYVVSCHYILAGFGAVFGVLSAAFATTKLRKKMDITLTWTNNEGERHPGSEEVNPENELEAVGLNLENSTYCKPEI